MLESLALVALLSTGTPAALQTPTAPIVTSRANGVLWDYPDAEAPTVTFRLCLDTQPCVTRTVDEAKQATLDPTTPAGNSTYGWKFPPLEIGAVHTVTAQACLVGTTEPECSLVSPETTVTFRAVAAPNDPQRLRLQEMK